MGETANALRAEQLPPVSGISSSGGRLFSTLAATFCQQAVKEQQHNAAADSQGHAPQVKSRLIS
jgi:hypothetical protein